MGSVWVLMKFQMLATWKRAYGCFALVKDVAKRAQLLWLELHPNDSGNHNMNNFILFD